MKRESDNLERLISRELDGECTPQDRESLAAVLNNDPRARALFEEYRELDCEAGDALRLALGRPARTVPLRRLWNRIGRGLIVAAAACLAVVAWLQPKTPGVDPRGAEARPAQAAMTSWFAPQVPQTDMVRPLPRAYERPELRLRGTQRDWIVIPGERPGMYLVIEVDRVRTHSIGVHQDF